MMTGLEQTGALAEHLLALIAGDCHEGPVYMDDQPFVVGDQHPFTRAIEHCGRLTQTLVVFIALTQFCADPQATEQSRPGEKNQTGAEYHPGITVDQLPSH